MLLDKTFWYHPVKTFAQKLHTHWDALLSLPKHLREISKWKTFVKKMTSNKFKNTVNYKKGKSVIFRLKILFSYLKKQYYRQKVKMDSKCPG